jgi:phosphoribosylformylglycinamidine synthase I
MRTAVVVFPGSNCDRDVVRSVSETLNSPVEMVWHEHEGFDSAPDLVIFPGGYSYGDYLRSGAMAAHSPIIPAVRRHAEYGGLVVGICNGFQILTETRMLPGILLSNTSLSFICRRSYIKVENTDTPFTAGLDAGAVLQFPIAHNEGLFFLPPDELKELERNKQVVFRYADPKSGKSGAEHAPNGSLNGIAGIVNERGNILGLMPHPERATVPHLNGGTDGVFFWRSIAKYFSERSAF